MAFVFIILFATANTSYAAPCDTDWPSFGKDLNNSRYSCENLGLEKLFTVWNFTSSFIESPQAYADGIVFTGSNDGNVYALNASDGSLIWNFTTGNGVESSPAVENGIVFIGSNDAKVYALNATDGSLIWNFTTGSYVHASPIVYNETVFIGSDDFNMYALNATDGSMIWNFTTGNVIYSSPAIYNNFVIFGSYDQTLYALDAANGSLVWQYQTGDNIRSSPAVYNDFVVFGSYDMTVYALDAANGSQRWFYTLEDTISSSPAFADGIVYVGSDDATEYALNASDGSLVWSSPTDDYPSSPAISNGTLFVSGGRLYAMNLSNGSILWNFQLDGFGFYSSPIVGNGMLFVSSDEGILYAFDEHTEGPFFINLTNQSINEDQSLSYIVSATDIAGVWCFNVSDTSNFSIDCFGYLQNVITLIPGMYIIDITSTDTLNNPSIITVTITVIARVINAVSSAVATTVTAVSSSFCSTEWKCTEWSECSNNAQSRACVKELPECYADNEKPSEIQECSSIPEQLFDISLGVEKTEIYSSDDLYATTSFESFGSKPVPVVIEFSILDSANRSVYTKNDSLVVYTQETIHYGFSNLTLSEGKYVIRMATSYSNVTNVYEKNFEILEKPYYQTIPSTVYAALAVIGLYIIYKVGTKYKSRLEKLREVVKSKNIARTDLLRMIAAMLLLIIVTKLLIGNKINIAYTVPLNILFGTAAVLTMIAYFYKKPQLVKFSCIFALAGWAYENILEKLFFPNAVSHYFWSLDTTTSFFWLIFLVYVIKRYSK